MRHYGISQWQLDKLLNKAKIKSVMCLIDIEKFDARLKLRRLTHTEIRQHHERARHGSAQAVVTMRRQMRDNGIAF